MNAIVEFLKNLVPKVGTIFAPASTTAVNEAVVVELASKSGISATAVTNGLGECVGYVSTHAAVSNGATTTMGTVIDFTSKQVITETAATVAGGETVAAGATVTEITAAETTTALGCSPLMAVVASVLTAVVGYKVGEGIGNYLAEKYPDFWVDKVGKALYDAGCTIGVDKVITYINEKGETLFPKKAVDIIQTSLQEQGLIAGGETFKASQLVENTTWCKLESNSCVADGTFDVNYNYGLLQNPTTDANIHAGTWSYKGSKHFAIGYDASTVSFYLYCYIINYQDNPADRGGACVGTYTNFNAGSYVDKNDPTRAISIISIAECTGGAYGTKNLNDIIKMLSVGKMVHFIFETSGKPDVRSVAYSILEMIDKANNAPEANKLPDGYELPLPDLRSTDAVKSYVAVDINVKGHYNSYYLKYTATANNEVISYFKGGGIYIGCVGYLQGLEIPDNTIDFLLEYFKDGKKTYSSGNTRAGFVSVSVDGYAGVIGTNIKVFNSYESALEYALNKTTDGIHTDGTPKPVEIPVVLPIEMPAIEFNPAPSIDPAPSPEIDPALDPETSPEKNPDPNPLPGTDNGLAPDPDKGVNPIKPPAPENPPIPGDGGDGGGSPEIPILIPIAASAISKVFNPTQEEVDALGHYMWSSSRLEDLMKLFQSPVEGIISLHKVYGIPSIGGKERIKLGYLDTGVNASVVESQFIEINCGTIKVSNSLRNALDYPPYTDIQIYLPFIGIQKLDAYDIVGSELTCVYRIDVYTGACIAQLKVKRGNLNSILYEFSGNCAYQVPLTSGDFIQALANVIGGAAVGGAAGAVMMGAIHSHADIGRSGSLSANPGILGTRIPYLIITRPVPYDATNYNQFYGYPSNRTVYLANCSGYTRVKDIVLHTTGTQEERDEIEQLLKEGVFVS